jgi:hypothetical protein
VRGWATIAVILWVVLAAYTTVVIANHGIGLLPIFFGDIGAMEWPGQFNLDFLMMLVVSASWTAWRNRFRPGGLALAAIAFFFGAGFLLIYLAYLIFRHRGDPAVVLLGDDYRSAAS